MNIFRHEKTNRVIGDDLVRCPITADFWEVTSGQLSASASLTQPTQAESAAGATAYSSTSAMTHSLPVFASGGSQAYLASGVPSQPVAIIATDGKQTYLGTISFEHKEMSIETVSSETFLTSLALLQLEAAIESLANSFASAFAQMRQDMHVLSGTAELPSTQGCTATASITQKFQNIFAHIRPSPAPFHPSIIPINVLTGRIYRRFKRVSYTKDGKAVFHGWSRH